MAAASEITELDDDELETRLTESRRELFNLRFQLATGQLDNYSRMVWVRKEIARLMTERRAREIAEAEGLAAEATPAHRAVARRRRADEEAGRVRVPAAERRAAERGGDQRGDDRAQEAQEDDDPAVVDAVIDDLAASQGAAESEAGQAAVNEADETGETAGPESEEES